MSNAKQEVAERFAGDVAQHVMTVEMDNGVHRCLHFGRRGSSAYAFRVVTWPGHLYIGGDCDDFVFARLTDMFDFFRSDSGRVNLSYWAEKLTSHAKSAGYEKYSPDMFRDTVKQWLNDWLEDEELSAEDEAALREQVDDEVLSCADDGEHAAYYAARHFRFNGRELFTDFWETNLRDYTYGFTWACHAIVWAIAQYDAAKAAERAADSAKVDSLEDALLGRVTQKPTVKTLHDDAMAACDAGNFAFAAVLEASALERAVSLRVSPATICILADGLIEIVKRIRDQAARDPMQIPEVDPCA